MRVDEPNSAVEEKGNGLLAVARQALPHRGIARAVRIQTVRKETPEHSARHKRTQDKNPGNASLRPGAEMRERLRRGRILWRTYTNAQVWISVWLFGDWPAHTSNPALSRK
jgi:hypothetical protein